MAEKEAAKTGPRIILLKSRKATKKSRKATQYSFALHLLSQGSLEKSRGEEKRESCGITVLTLKWDLYFTEIHQGPHTVLSHVNMFIVKKVSIWSK